MGILGVIERFVNAFGRAMAQETKVTGNMMHKTCTTFRSVRITVPRLMDQKHVQPIEHQHMTASWSRKEIQMSRSSR